MRLQTPKEEFFNVVTHGIGFLLSIIGFVILLVFNSQDASVSTIAICLFGASLLTLYLASTLYHLISNVKTKYIFRKLDHISIYLLIAGTYSPVTLLFLSESKGLLLFWIVWGIALLGTVLKLFFTGKYEVLSVILYLVMGWLIVFDISALMKVISSSSLYLLIAGGLFYTVGILFYALDKIKYNHVIWHVFVLCGSISHYLFILNEI